MTVEPATYTVDEAAAIVGCSSRHLYELCRRGEFPHLKLGAKVVIPKRRLEAWLEGEAKE